jgi:DNA-binding CsgD family transcriptional regulator
MSDKSPEDVFVLLCDWRGHIVWISDLAKRDRIGDLAWSNLTPDSLVRAQETHGKVCASRELQTMRLENLQGVHFRCWSWPLDSPEIAVCTLGMEVPPALDELSPRESECLELLAQGLDARALAEKLDLSPNTVHTHLKGAREKLGLPNLESLISFAARYCYPRSIPLTKQM